MLSKHQFFVEKGKKPKVLIVSGFGAQKREISFFLISFFVLFLFSLLVSDTFSSLLFLFFLLFLLSFCSHSFLSSKCFLTAEEWPVYTDSIELSHPQTSGTIFLYFGLFKSPLGSNEPICRL